MSEFSIAITRVVRPGYEQQFETELSQFVNDSMTSEGVVGVHILRPPPDSNSREYGILRSFACEKGAKEFYESKLFKKWLSTVAPMVEGEPHRKRLDGVEVFFPPAAIAPPPKWKLACVTFLGVLPTVLLCVNSIEPLLGNSHWFLKAVVVNAAVVALLTWVVLPSLNQGFRGWLHDEPAKHNLSE